MSKLTKSCFGCKKILSTDFDAPLIDAETWNLEQCNDDKTKFQIYICKKCESSKQNLIMSFHQRPSRPVIYNVKTLSQFEKDVEKNIEDSKKRYLQNQNIFTLSKKEKVLFDAYHPAVIRFVDGEIDLKEMWTSKIKIIGSNSTLSITKSLIAPFLGKTMSVIEMTKSMTEKQLSDLTFEKT
jgi:hypothetical protein